MSLSARAYIALIIALGAACIARGVWFWVPHDLLRFGCYLMLAIPAACLKYLRSLGHAVLFVFLAGRILGLWKPSSFDHTSSFVRVS